LADVLAKELAVRAELAAGRVIPSWVDAYVVPAAQEAD
jgi:hypothetical protein